jgi:hypothetical protein
MPRNKLGPPAGFVGRAEVVQDAAEPRTAPVRTVGSFDEALRCMDNLFLSHGKRYTNVTTAGIPTPPA